MRTKAQLTRHAELQRGYHAADPGRIRARNRAWAKANPEKWKIYMRRAKLKREYGITIAEYDRMFMAQGRRCACCKSDKPNGNNWHIDHNHETNVVRGILCHTCNVGLGHFRDSVVRLKDAIDYLSRTNNQEA
jgi:hypothetical protein